MKIARTLFLVSILLIGSRCIAQYTGYEWQVRNYDEVIGKDVTIQFSISDYGIIYMPNEKGKLKQLPDEMAYKDIFCYKKNTYRIVGYHNDKKRQYLQVRFEGRDYYILLDPENPQKHTRTMANLQALEDIVSECNEKYIYLNRDKLYKYDFNQSLDDKNLQLVANAACKVRWLSYDLSGINSEAQLKGAIIRNIGTTNFSIRMSKLDPGDFYTEAEMTLLYEAMERQKALDSIEDRIPHAFRVKSKISSINLEEGDTVFMFSKTQGWYNEELLTIPSYYTSSLEKVILPGSQSAFSYNDFCKYLDRRDAIGLEIRKETARVADSMATDVRLEILRQKLNVLIDELKAIHDEWNQKKIFLIGKEYSYSDDIDAEFGLKLEFYNCFKKTIKYIKFETKSYNQVGDLQKDYLGRTVSGGKCIGPIEPGESGTYNFDELYWDEYDIISRLCVTSVTFTFMDNSTVTYTDINSHISKSVFNNKY